MRFWLQLIVIFMISLIPASGISLFMHLSFSGFVVIWILLSIFLLFKLWDDIVIKVDPLQAVIIEDKMTGNLRIMGPGLHTKYSWPEKVYQKISLTESKLSIKEDKYETTDSPVVVSGTLVYQPDTQHLNYYIRRKNEDLTEILTALIKNTIGVILAEKNSIDAVKQRNGIGQEISAKFKEEIGNYQREDMLGITVLSFTVNNMRLDPELEKERTREESEKAQRRSERTEQEAFAEQIQFYVDKFGWTAKQAADYVMQTHNRGTKRIIVDMQGEENGKKPNLDLKIDDK